MCLAYFVLLQTRPSAKTSQRNSSRGRPLPSGLREVREVLVLMHVAGPVVLARPTIRARLLCSAVRQDDQHLFDHRHVCRRAIASWKSLHSARCTSAVDASEIRLAGEREEKQQSEHLRVSLQAWRPQQTMSKTHSIKAGARLVFLLVPECPSSKRRYH